MTPEERLALHMDAELATITGQSSTLSQQWASAFAPEVKRLIEAAFTQGYYGNPAARGGHGVTEVDWEALLAGGAHE